MASNAGQRQQAVAAGMMVLALSVMGIQAANAEHSGPIASLQVDERLLAYTPTQQVSGTLKVQGSDTMASLMHRLSSEFQRRQSKVSATTVGGGSNKAITQFLETPLKFTGKINLKEERPAHPAVIASSRPLTEKELKEFVTTHGYEPLAVPVAMDAVALYVNAENPLQGLTLDQVDAIFSAGQQRGHQAAVTQWGQLGLGHNWESSPVHMYGRDSRSGTRAFFQEHALAGGAFSSKVVEEPGAASVILDVMRDPVGIGYSGIGLETANTHIIAIAENANSPFVMPTAATVADQTYPLRRLLYLYVDKAPGASLTPAVQEFLSFVTSRDGQEAVVKAGFFPVPVDQFKKGMFALEPIGVVAPVSN
ncbi:MAG: PstS family phosphate ABC transporter substrate-binding protein [Nitrospiraceae bacterium]